METATDFLFLGSKITADGDCGHEIKRHLLLGRKAMTKLKAYLKSRDITLPTKVHLVKAMIFPGVMYGCESWTIKKVEHRRIDAFELWCWRRLLRVPWTARRSNQSILKEISPEYSLKGLILKLKLQYFGHQMWRTDSLERPWCWEGLGAGGEGDDRGWDSWIASWTRWTWVWASSGSWWWTGKPGVLQSMGLQRVGHNWANELTDWLRYTIYEGAGTPKNFLCSVLCSQLQRPENWWFEKLSFSWWLTHKWWNKRFWPRVCCPFTFLFLKKTFLVWKLQASHVLSGKESASSVGDGIEAGSIPDLESSPGLGNGNPLQYSCLENCMNEGAWWAVVHGVRNSLA